MHPTLTILTETANVVSLNDAASDLSYAINTSAHTHNLSSAPWNGISSGVVIGSGAITSPAPGNIVIGSGAWAGANNSIVIGSHTHTVTNLPAVEALPDGTSVRFVTGEKTYTGEVVSAETEGYAAPLYVVQPDNPLPKTGSKPIIRSHSQIERITFLQRFTEAVWAEE